MAEDNLGRQSEGLKKPEEAIPEKRVLSESDLTAVENKIARIEEFSGRIKRLQAWQTRPESIKMPGDYEDRERLAIVNDNKLRTNWFNQCFGLMQEASEEFGVSQSDLLSLWAEFTALRKEEAAYSKDEFDILMIGRDMAVLDDPKALVRIVAESKKKAALKFVRQRLSLVAQFEKMLESYQQALAGLKVHYEKDKSA